MYAAVERSDSQKSSYTTAIYNRTRDKVIEFLGADPEKHTCFYTNSTTDGLNKLASALVTSKKDIVLATRIEHHANDLSWRERCKVKYAEVDSKGRVKYNELKKILKKYNKKKKGKKKKKTKKIKVVSITAASNVTGYVTDVHRVARLAHKYGAKLVVDGAQIVAHRKFSMVGEVKDPNDAIDFFAFSAHKMYSPEGGGAVVGLTKVLNKHKPMFYGGGTIKVVGDNWVYWKKAPEVYEAGSPDYLAVVGLGAAIDCLSTIGMNNIQAHEQVLIKKLIAGLKKLPKVIIYGDTVNVSDKTGVVAFNFHDINTAFLAERLAKYAGIDTRRGAFCAHPYVWRLMGISDATAKGFENCSDENTAGMVRISFASYTTEAEIDYFFEQMPAVMNQARKMTQESDVNPEY
jgi:selenocysteine lyase/cysteine desulfurase